MAAWYGEGLLKVVVKADSEVDWPDIRRQLREMGCELKKVETRQACGTWLELKQED